MSAETRPSDGTPEPDHYLISRHKRGLSPTAHVPHEDDPGRPMCNLPSGSGKGWKEIDPAEVEPDQVCGRCTDLDNRGKPTSRDVFWILADEDVTSIEDARKVSRGVLR